MAQFFLKMTLEQWDPCDSSLPNLGYGDAEMVDKASADRYRALQKCGNKFMSPCQVSVQTRFGVRQDEETRIKPRIKRKEINPMGGGGGGA